MIFSFSTISCLYKDCLLGALWRSPRENLCTLTDLWEFVSSGLDSKVLLLLASLSGTVCICLQSLSLVKLKYHFYHSEVYISGQESFLYSYPGEVCPHQSFF